MATSEMKQSGRHEAEPALRRSEERFRLLVESVVDYAIFILDPHGFIETWNIGAERVKGYTEEQILGQHYSVFYTEEDREQELPRRYLIEARQRGHVERSGWRVRRDGSRFWADVVITALHNEDGTLAGFAKVTRDRTDDHRTQVARQEALDEQRRIVERLEELDRWRRQFVGSVAHDLQTPVTSIAGFAELLLGETSEDERREFLKRIVSNVHALSALIDHLRTYSLLESGHVELAPERIYLVRFMTDVVADMAPILDGHVLELDVEDTAVSADRGGLERILRNLLTNAAWHTPSGAAIRIRARSAEDAVRVEVEDEGAGIPEEAMSGIFERFEHGARHGTGLGLSIVKQYVQLHGGEVSATSEVGQGATFGFTLPR